MKKKFSKIMGVGLTVILLVSLTIGFVGTPVAAADAGWSRVLPPSITVGRVLTTVGATIGPMAQAIDGTLYAYDSSGATTQLYKSTDGGYTWAATGAPAVGAIVAIVTSAEEADVVYFATAANVYKSIDAGTSFVTLAAAPVGHTIVSLDVAKMDGTYIMVIGTAAAGAGDVWTMDESVAFPAWTNMGFNAAMATAVDTVVAVKFSPNFLVDRGIVAIGTDAVPANTYLSSKFGGAAWGGTIGNPPAIASACTVGDIGFPSGFNYTTNPNFFFGIDGAGGGVYLFQGVVSPLPSVRTLISAAAQVATMDVSGTVTGATIVAGTTGGTVIRSLNGGASWTPVLKQPSGNGIAYVALDYADATQAYALVRGNNGGLSLSIDSGSTWNQISLILTSLASIDDLSVADDTIFMATTTNQFAAGVAADSFTLLADDIGNQVDTVTFQGSGSADTFTFTGAAGGEVAGTYAATAGSVTVAITTDADGDATIIGNVVRLPDAADVATFTATANNTLGTLSTWGPGVGGEALAVAADADGDALIGGASPTWSFSLPDSGTVVGTVAWTAGSGTIAITTDADGDATIVGNVITLPDAADVATIYARTNNTTGTLTVVGGGSETVAAGVDVGTVGAVAVGGATPNWTFSLPDSTNDVVTIAVTTGSVSVAMSGTGTYVGGVITFASPNETATVAATANGTTGTTAITAGNPTLWSTYDADGDASIVFPGAFSAPDAATAAGAPITEIWRYASSWERVFTSTIYGSADMVEVSPDGSAVFAAALGGTTIWRSINNGQSWTAQATAVGGSVGGTDPIQGWVIIDSSTVITGAAAKVCMTGNNGLSWTEPAVVGTGNIVNFALEPGYDGVGLNDILAGDSTGDVSVSTDAGLTWGTGSATGLGGTIFPAFDASYDTNGTIYATSSLGNVARRVGVAAWAVIDNQGQAGEFPVLVGGGIEAGADGTLYVADSAAGMGVMRCLNPTATVSAVTGNPYWEEAWDYAATTVLTTQTFNGLWLTEGSTKLWSIDTTGLALYHYTDTLSAQVAPAGPSNGSTVTTTTSATLSWTALSGATAYQVQVNTREDFSAVTMAGTYTYYTWDLLTASVTNLTGGTTYYWRVRVANSAAPNVGAPLRSEWSDTWSFTTNVSAPPAATSRTPANGATGVILTPNFAWGAVAGATMYQLELTTDPTFAEITEGQVLDIPAAQPYYVWPTELEYETSYYWRVRASTATGNSTWITSVFTTRDAPAEEPAEEWVSPYTGQKFDSEAALLAHIAAWEAAHPEPEEETPAYIWAVIGIGAVLVVAVLVLIFRTRRPV